MKANAAPPYSVPDNWRWINVGKVSALYHGVSYKKDDAHTRKGTDDVLILRGGNIREGYIDIDSDNVYVNSSLVSQTQIVCKHDIVIVGSTGSKAVIGRAGIAHENYNDVSFGAFLLLVRPAGMINPQYLDYYFLSGDYRNTIRGLAKGININNIRADYITQCSIPFPPLAEQQRIVERVESLFLQLDEARRKAQAVVDGFELRKAAILHRAFTGELTAQWREIHRIDLNAWRIQKLSETTITIIDGDRGKNYPKKDDFSESGYCIFLNAKNVTKNGFVFDECEYITKEKDESLRSGRLERGDMIMTTRGTIGNIAIYDDSVPYNHLRINSGMVIYRGGEEFIKPYLIWLYQSKLIENQIHSLQTGSAQPQLPIKVMKRLALPIPTIPEQEAIVNELNSLITKERQAKEIAKCVIARIDAMKRVILGRAFRGQLGTNDPNEPPAAVDKI